MGAAITEYVGKRVDITFSPEAFDGETDPVTQVTGKVENANEIGFVFKPAGSSKSRLYQVEHIETIAMAPEAEPVLRARRLDPATLKGVKRHLVDRHGYTLEDINAMSPERGLDFHDDEVNHEGLGHFHAEPKAKQDDAAEAAPVAEPAVAQEDDQEFVFEDDSEPGF